MSRLLIPASVLPRFIDMAVQHRLSVDALFREAGVNPSCVGSPEQYLTFEQLSTLLESAAASSRDPAFALHFGEQTTYAALDVVGRLIATSATLREAIEQWLRYKDLVVPYAEFALECEGDAAVFAFTLSDEQARRNRSFYQESIMAAVVTLARSLFGGELAVTALRFAHSAPAHLSEYQRLFRAPLAFECPRNELHLDGAQLEVALPSAYSEYHRRLEELAQARLSRIAARQDWVGRVWAALETCLDQGRKDVETVAEQLHMSPRTLQRKLKQQGYSFLGLRDQLCHRRACRYLEDSQADLSAIAHALGFRDAGNFCHAFKRWQGQTPGAYRRCVARR